MSGLELLLAATDAAAEPTTGELMQLVADYSYIGVFLFLVACGLGFPSPEEVALIGGGFAVHQNHPAPDGWPWMLLMIAVAMLGVLVGDSILWWIGRKVGDRPERVPLIGRHLTPDRMQKARGLFQRHGAKAVFFGRFLFGIRAVTFFVSGSLRVPLSTFLLMDGLAALVSVPISVFLAWWFGDTLEEAGRWLGRLHQGIFVVVAVAAVIALTLFWRHRKRLLLAEGAVAAAPEVQPAGQAGG
ncbi:MAG: DedA family protein [Planctomycetes bacterium]|nr:DedA family protein [Planctomycetota bacterium]